MVAFLSQSPRNGGAPLAPGVALRKGQVLAGKYRVEELLGCSATAMVVRARHIHLRHAVTVKILSAYTEAQLEAVTRQVERARVAARLKGRHVARILDIGTTDDGSSFIATEHLDGHTLERELELREKLPVDEALGVVIDACEGLAEAHARGLSHGDLKPKNLFFQERGEGKRRVLKILDFGMLAPIEAAGDASATAWFGMPSYLAPEQIRDPGSCDARVDVWALGVILHRLITGALPFTADTVSGVLVAVCFDAAPLASEAPYELARLVHRCLAKDPADRPKDVEELATELGRFLGPDGERRSARVRKALSTPPPSDRKGADESGSIAPVSIPSAAPPAPRTARTGPSQRIRERQARARRIAIGTFVAVSAIAAAAIVARPPASIRAPRAAIEPDDDMIIPGPPSAEAPPPPPAVLAPAAPAAPAAPLIEVADLRPAASEPAPKPPAATTSEPRREPTPRVHAAPARRGHGDHKRAADPRTLFDDRE